MIDTLFVYIDGSDLEECYSQVAPQLQALSAEWRHKGCHFVDDRHPVTADLKPHDLPDWSLGLNLPLAALGRAEAERLVELCRTLARASGREFVIGFASRGGRSEDVLFVGPDTSCPVEVAHLLGHVAGA